MTSNSPVKSGPSHTGAGDDGNRMASLTVRWEAESQLLESPMPGNGPVGIGGGGGGDDPNGHGALPYSTRVGIGQYSYGL